MTAVFLAINARAEGGLEVCGWGYEDRSEKGGGFHHEITWAMPVC